MHKIAINLRYLRLKSGMTQVQLAQKMGVSRPTVRAAESFDHDAPSLKTLSKMARALEVDADEIYKLRFDIQTMRLCASSDIKSPEQVIAQVLIEYEKHNANMQNNATWDELVEKTSTYMDNAPGRVAAIVRKMMGLDQLQPLPLMCGVASWFGVASMTIDYTCKDVGVAARVNGDRLICCAASDRSTSAEIEHMLAVQFGHLILHDHDDFCTDGHPIHEREEAEAFAIELRMPRQGLERLSEVYASATDIYSVGGVDLFVDRIAQYFDVDRGCVELAISIGVNDG